MYDFTAVRLQLFRNNWINSQFSWFWHIQLKYLPRWFFFSRAIRILWPCQNIISNFLPFLVGYSRAAVKITRHTRERVMMNTNIREESFCYTQFFFFLSISHFNCDGRPYICPTDPSFILFVADLFERLIEPNERKTYMSIKKGIVYLWKVESWSIVT